MTMEIYRDKLIEARRILENEGPPKFYEFLESCGFPYATLANGVAKGDSFAGNAALDFMKATALESGRPLSNEDVDNIRVLMAKGYLSALEFKMGDANILTEEITYREAWDFHAEIFASYGLPADAWTLNSVFQSFSEEESNVYWGRVLESAGNSSAELSLSVLTLYQMFSKTDLMSGDPDLDSVNNARFISWLQRVATFESTKEFIAIYGDKLGDLKTVYFDQFIGSRVVSESVNALFRESMSPILYDPLVLDLDGDGIETVSADGGIKFDFDGDGLKTATGWIGSDDGILAIDKNGNGNIDNGAELFGVDYVKKDGNKAIDGYDALRDKDTNADGVFDVNDEEFDAVKVWRDLNQDGIAQQEELASLSDMGIVSISLSSSTVNIDDNGNLIANQGTFTKNNGATGTVEASIQDSASINFAENPFHSEFVDKLPLGQDELLLPNIAGRGVLRGLQEAAVLNQNLTDLVGKFNIDVSPLGKTQIVDQIVSEWAKTGVSQGLNDRLIESGGAAAGFNLSDEFLNSEYVKKLIILEKFNGSNFINFEYSDGEYYDDLIVEFGGRRHSITKTSDQTAEVGDSNILLTPVEKFVIDRMYSALLADIYSGISAYGSLKQTIDLVGIDMSSLETGVKYSFDDAITALREDFSQDHIGATRDLVDVINLFGADPKLISLFAEFSGDFAPGDLAQLGVLPPEFITSNPLTRTDVLKYNIVISDEDSINGQNGVDFIISNKNNNVMSGYGGSDTYIITSNSGDDTIFEYADADGKSENTVIFAGIKSDEIEEVYKLNEDLVIRYQGSNSLTLSRFFFSEEGTVKIFVFDDKVMNISDLKQIAKIKGTDSSDVIIGFSGAINYIDAFNGDDHIRAGNDGSVVHAGSGDDYISGGSGDDVIFGEAGNDTIDGYQGNDTYVFSRGDGQDTVSDLNDDFSIDRIVFTDVLSSEIVSLTKQAQSLFIDYGAGDVIELKRFFDYEQSFNGGIQFSDGLVWTREQVLSKAVVIGTDGNDVLLGFDGAPNTIIAGSGDDYIRGGHDGNTIHAGSGDDVVDGGNGDDVMYGEAGNDRLEGYLGNDTYVFSRGDGKDVIKDLNDGGDNTDKIIFTDVLPSEILSVIKINQNLLIDYGSGDSLELERFFDYESSFSGGVTFADGSVWNREQIMAKTLVIGTDGNDVLFGFNGAANTIMAGSGDDYITGSNDGNTIYGGSGNDIISGGNGDDRIFGGSGNDTIEGYLGNDTYVFSRGDGQDSIKDMNDDMSVDKIVFTDVLSSEIVSIVKKNQNLLIDYGSGDTLELVRFFDYAQSFNGGIEFSDGSIWSREDILSRTRVFGTDGNDVLFGFDGARNNIFAGAGDDYITGSHFGNTIYGESGNDVIYGGDGDDWISGGSGDDSIEGYQGNDTYVFSRGDGLDTVKDLNYDSSVDKIVFTDVNSTEIVSLVKNKQDLLIDYGSGDQIKLLSFFDYANSFNGGIEFADGSVWSRDQILSKTIVKGTEENDVLFGFNGARNTIFGASGDDYITGGQNGNTIYGGDGNDQIYGGDESDTLYGERGNDILEGYMGSDTYVFSRGDGQDTIKENDYDVSAFDRIKFTDVYPDEIVSLSKLKQDLFIDYGSGDSITLPGFFNYSLAMNGGIEFGDGSVWGRSEMLAKTVVVGTDDNDILYGFSGAPNTIIAGSGDDQIYGSDLDDSIYGQAGNDIIYSSDGSDTYFFSRGDGQDTISEIGYDSSISDKISFVDVVSDEIVSMLKKNQDLIIDYGHDDTLRLTGFFNYEYAFNGGIEFADGSAWSREDMLKNTVVRGTDGNDTLYGFNGATSTIIAGGGDDYITSGRDGSIIYAGDGNDIIYGGESDDIIYGGKGDDIMDGYLGNDTYVFQVGDGHDVINGKVYTDQYPETIKFLDVNNLTSASIDQGTGYLVIGYGADDQITLKNYFNSPQAFSGGIEFADGSKLSKEDLTEITLDNQAAVLSQSMASFGSSSLDVQAQPNYIDHQENMLVAPT